ncbi:reverse transcriptase [Cucumis melo var. makuwa]|uniref:Reverse transcriptase n=1 Tax=Cucumis melo var. makuwa TaxID=1194695 RepID=A0A5A7U668_CUCMM|nr:reverse transcriptase [Cucumis melo var. makuwa]TYK08905.1 reverse transcriptase [Cucumis melo var. makuwa]
MLYLAKVPDSIRFLESRLEEINEKTDIIDAVAARVERLPIQELLARVDTLEGNIGRTVNYEYGDSLSGFVAHMEERVNELDSSQKTLLEMINDMSEDFRATLDIIRNEIADVNSRLNLTVRAIANQAQTRGVILLSRVKIPKPKALLWGKKCKGLGELYFWPRTTLQGCICVRMPSYGGDLDLWICKKDVLHELKHTRSIQEYVKQFTSLMLDIHDMWEKDNFLCFFKGLKPWAKTKLFEHRVQDLTSAYAAGERLFDLISDFQDVRRHQSSLPGRNKKE